MKKENKQLKRDKNILYTGFGDKGTTTLFHCDQGRISKSAHIIETLGSLDELNAYIGVVKLQPKVDEVNLLIDKKKVNIITILNDIQQVLFVIQAELAGSDMTVKKVELKKIEKVITVISDILPPITSFTIAGGSLLSAELDVSRTLSRRCERRIIGAVDEGKTKIGLVTIAYLNRLSSVFFALSRYTNHILSIPENHPNYNKE